MSHLLDFTEPALNLVPCALRAIAPDIAEVRGALPTVNPGDDDEDDEGTGNIEPDEDEDVDDDEEEDDEDDPLWARPAPPSQRRIPLRLLRRNKPPIRRAPSRAHTAPPTFAPAP